MDVWKTFKSRVYGCFTGMPHESKINRKHEVPMSIDLKDEFIGKSPPPPRTYRTPHHLLEVLKRSIIEMLKAGWIRASTSEYCAPVLVLVKPHQDVKNMNPVDIKYRVCVDLSDLNKRTKTIHYRVPDVTSAWDKLSKCKYFSVLDLEKGFGSRRFVKTMDPSNGLHLDVNSAIMSSLRHQWVLKIVRPTFKMESRVCLRELD